MTLIEFIMEVEELTRLFEDRMTSKKLDKECSFEEWMEVYAYFLKDYVLNREEGS